MSQKERLDVEETLAKVRDLKIQSVISAEFNVNNRVHARALREEAEGE